MTPQFYSIILPPFRHFLIYAVKQSIAFHPRRLTLQIIRQAVVAPHQFLQSVCLSSPDREFNEFRAILVLRAMARCARERFAIEPERTPRCSLARREHR